MNYKQTYEAIRAKLAAETERRSGRDLDAWILAERECVAREVNQLRACRGYAPVSIDRIERAERMACGHSDYVSQYAHAAADLALQEHP